MKKLIVIIFISLIGIISTQAQKLDALVINGVKNVKSATEANFRIFSLDICPITIGYAKNIHLGIYFQNDEYYNKNETKFWTARTTQFHIGLSVNSTFGYDENWYLKFRSGFGWMKTSGESIQNGIYQDIQKDKDFIFDFSLFRWNQDRNWLSQHQLQINFRQPIKTKKVAWWNLDPLNSVSTWNNQIVRINLNETVYSLYVNHNDDWLLNFDIHAGYGFEHQIIKVESYPIIGAGISIFKRPYHYQNMVELGIEEQFFNSASRTILMAKVNLVPLLFLSGTK